MSGLPAIVCTPWCVDGHGHGDNTHREDQCCQSSGAEFGAVLGRGSVTVTVYARRDTQGAQVELHVYGDDEDVNPCISPETARAMAGALLAAADRAEQR